MKNLFFLTFCLIFWGCKDNVKKPLSTEIDTLLSEYISLSDSSFRLNEWGNDDYVILKSLILKDTNLKNLIINKLELLRLSKSNNKKTDNILKKIYDTIKLKEIGNIDCEEVYRFTLTSAYNPDWYFVTVYKNKNRYTLEGLHAIINFHQKTKIISKKQTEITINEWDSLKSLINGSYIWTMYPEDNPNLYHGSKWNYDCRINYNDSTIAKHSVYRRRPNDGSFKNIGLYLLKLSKIEIKEMY